MLFETMWKSIGTAALNLYDKTTLQIVPFLLHGNAAVMYFVFSFYRLYTFKKIRFSSHPYHGKISTGASLSRGVTRMQRLQMINVLSSTVKPL